MQDGYLDIVTGGIAEGQELLHRPEVDDAMLTGGTATYDAIVWGPPNEREANKAADRKIFNKPIHAELGACSPWVIVPGNWTESELVHHADILIASKLVNGGAVCASPQILITDKSWPQRERFLDVLRDRIRKHTQGAKPYYPGTAQRCEAACKAAANFEKFNREASDLFFVPDLDQGAYGFTHEAFGPVLYETSFESNGDIPSYLNQVKEFVNSDQVFGSLSMSVMIKGQTENANKAAFEEFIDGLEWGTIAVNEWAAMSNMMPALVWGAFPKHNPKDIQSGSGFMNNALMVNEIQKCVIRAPFVNMAHSKPSASSAKKLERFSYYSNYPTTWRLLGLLSSALIGI
jgi:acyl-CoA reductase-like NAD-dependent aldehyde dehydrogenase